MAHDLFNAEETEETEYEGDGDFTEQEEWQEEEEAPVEAAAPEAQPPIEAEAEEEGAPLYNPAQFVRPEGFDEFKAQFGHLYDDEQLAANIQMAHIIATQMMQGQAAYASQAQQMGLTPEFTREYGGMMDAVATTIDSRQRGTKEAAVTTVAGAFLQEANRVGVKKAVEKFHKLLNGGQAAAAERQTPQRIAPQQRTAASNIQPPASNRPARGGSGATRLLATMFDLDESDARLALRDARPKERRP